MNSHFTAGFADELVKTGGLMDILTGSVDDKAWNMTKEYTRRAARGGMKSFGLDPDKASHKALAAGAVGVPAAMMASAPFRASANRRRIKKLEQQLAAKSSGGIAGKIMKALRRGR